ncbi:hypothetical protein ONZ51_g13259 [Trametes cubensis]|uniref:Uncharacterized protein n=1 Tax=Trametes cubensis TaxID=1111947 RepID=A0AAD7TEL1_9APHY|nr:hypothetical protein ONZ51_g13259 [Trametes cubensis]
MPVTRSATRNGPPPAESTLILGLPGEFSTEMEDTSTFGSSLSSVSAQEDIQNTEENQLSALSQAATSRPPSAEPAAREETPVPQGQGYHRDPDVLSTTRTMKTGPTALVPASETLDERATTSVKTEDTSWLHRAASARELPPPSRAQRGRRGRGAGHFGRSLP